MNIGFLTAYVPVELFHAAGFTPVYLFPAPETRAGGPGDRLLPSFVCWVVKSALDRALTGELAGLALAKTCDATQGLADLWPRVASRAPLFHFGMPTRLGDVARPYLLAELADLRARLEAHIGRPIPDDALRASIVHYNQTRAAVRALYSRAAVRALYSRAADFLPSELYAHIRAHLTGTPAPYPLLPTPYSLLPTPYSLPLILAGPELGDPALFEAMDGLNVRVAGDLFDLGERYFAVDAAETGEPLAAVAGRLLSLLPTPTKHHPARGRAAHLLALARERGARGVVFARQKFCDPHGFEYVPLARALDGAGLPYLSIELEQSPQAGQLRTRIEAFVEMLGVKRDA